MSDVLAGADCLFQKSPSKFVESNVVLSTLQADGSGGCSTGKTRLVETHYRDTLLFMRVRARDAGDRKTLARRDTISNEPLGM